MSAVRHFLDLNVIPRRQLRDIIDNARLMKKKRKKTVRRLLDGRALAMIFERPSTRTRVSFELAMRQLGGDALMLTAEEMQLGRGETLADTARVLSRYVDVIMIRPLNHTQLAEFAGTVPTLTLGMASIGIFPGARNVLYLAPVMSGELLALHRSFHDGFSAFAGSCWEHYRPVAFVPHVTLAMNATHEALQRAVAIVVEHWQPAAARLHGVRLIEFRPVRTLYQRPL